MTLRISPGSERKEELAVSSVEFVNVKGMSVMR